jgi:hypothetical protein
MAEEPAPKRKRCSDGDSVAEVLKLFLAKPGDIQYRETISEGSPNYDQIKKHGQLLRALRAGPLADGALTQAAAKKALRELAAEKANEADWCLGEELDNFCEKIGKRLRAMLRDVQQGIYKSKGRTLPEWLGPFAMVGGPLAEAAAEVEGEQPKPLDAPAGQTAAAAPASPSEASNLGDDLASAATAAPKVETPGNDLYFFAWDDEEQLAYRKPCANLDAKHDWCMKVSRPGGSSDVMDAVAWWSDGMSWKIPGHTVGDAVRGKAAGKISKIPEFWTGEFHTDKSKVFGKTVTSKDKASVFENTLCTHLGPN